MFNLHTRHFSVLRPDITSVLLELSSSSHCVQTNPSLRLSIGSSFTRTSHETPRRLCHRVLHPVLDLPLCGSVTNRPLFFAACHSRARFIFNSLSSSSSFSLPVGGSALHYSNDLLTNTQATIVIERRPLFGLHPARIADLPPSRTGRLCRIIQLPRSFAR